MDITASYRTQKKKIKMKVIGNINKQTNVSLLKDMQTREKYKLNLANKFQVLQEQHEEEPDRGRTSERY